MPAISIKRLVKLTNGAGRWGERGSEKALRNQSALRSACREDDGDGEREMVSIKLKRRAQRIGLAVRRINVKGG